MKIIIIAEPNGAGKTMFARSFLPADMAIARVAERVKQGGHNIPTAIVVSKDEKIIWRTAAELARMGRTEGNKK